MYVAIDLHSRGVPIIRSANWYGWYYMIIGNSSISKHSDMSTDISNNNSGWSKSWLSGGQEAIPYTNT